LRAASGVVNFAIAELITQIVPLETESRLTKLFPKSTVSPLGLISELPLKTKRPAGVLITLPASLHPQPFAQKGSQMQTNDTPFNCQLCLKIIDGQFFEREHLLVWSGPFTHRDLMQGFTFCTQNFTVDRCEAIVRNLQQERTRVDQILANLTKEKGEKR
jgi:hypothetical protein